MNKPENNDQERKDAAYPYYDLEACIKFTSNLKDIGGSKGGVKKSLLAKKVGLAESTPSFFQRLSAAKVFGIIEGWGSYTLTESGRKYFYPQSDNDKNEAVLTMFLTPPAFEFIVKRFDGDKLPTTEIMGNIFHQELSVPDSWKDRVAQIFTRSAHFAGIIDTGGFLRYDAAVHTRTTETPENQPIPATKTEGFAEVGVKLSAPQTAKSGITTWSHGDKIKVQTPDPITKEIWEKLNAYVQILKPSGNE
jgi:hypothetical protein